MKLKICGMKFLENILEISQLEPDLLGFIFYENSSRNFEGKIPELPEKIKKAGVFVNATFEEITSKLDIHKLDYIQLHGNESPEFCLKLQNKIPIIKAFSIDENFDFKILKNYSESCTYFLFDTKGKNHGGNGMAFDWNILENYKLEKKYFLSGGISLENVSDLKEFLKKDYAKNCLGIDINSKFEIAPGLKNTEKIIAFKSKL
ncbi:phosphoribosylanthranilate isomerase [Flavobacterium macacae]|uniref:N-(5'-phosphoribosyl)anthranilate isomerase n=1 Tax=Flavobacterium macacae TaxID=2488993 RepID=A0A3P3W566_9FLAO|nr:phosphoribosylanthranilate isomerase [Flavobacterium macacae]